MAGHRPFAGGADSPDSISSVTKAAPDFDAAVDDTRHDDLELGLTLGAKAVASGAAGAGLKPAVPWGQCCRILTAEDFPSLGSRASPKTSSASSVSSSSPPAAAPVTNLDGGTKRTNADVDASSPQVQSHMVVGWPPVGSFRMNNLFSLSKDVNTSEIEAERVDVIKKASQCSSHDSAKGKVSRDQKRRGQSAKSSLLVKVNMDGDPIGRKVDLSVHHSYENLAVRLDQMFHKPNGAKASRLLDGSSEFALTYEDKDGDWLLLGDVPWEMFLDTVKRLRIMRTSDANGLAPRFESFSKANGCTSKLLQMRKPDRVTLWGD